MRARKNRLPSVEVKSWFDTRKQLTDQIDRIPEVSDDDRTAMKTAVLDLYRNYANGLSVRLAGN